MKKVLFSTKIKKNVDLILQVILPGDRKLEEEYSKDRPPSLMDQLADVQAHIEDLHVVIDRTTEAVDLDLYNAPLCSDFSELRIDY